jgi:copper chaperone CopZ
MCKNTIESAAEKPDGVFWAEWDGELKQVTVKFDSTMVNIDDIERQIALAGYDTPNHKAEDDVYNSLPGCCKYERQ